MLCVPEFEYRSWFSHILLFSHFHYEKFVIEHKWSRLSWSQRSGRRHGYEQQSRNKSTLIKKKIPFLNWNRMKNDSSGKKWSNCQMKKKKLNYIFGIIARKQLKSIEMKSLAFEQYKKSHSSQGRTSKLWIKSLLFLFAIEKASDRHFRHF